MSELEEEARPFLIPLMLGESLTLTKEDLNKVSRWIALKVMVAEHDNPKTHVTPKSDRYEFRRTGEIPPFFDIRIAAHSLTSSVGYIRHAETMSRAGNRSIPTSYPIKNVQDVHFIAGKLLVVCGASCGNFAINEMFDVRPDVLPRIWPSCCETLYWPPKRVLGVQEVSALAQRLQAFKSVNKVIWLPHPLES